MSTIAERLKEVRKEKRMTQTELGEKLGVTKQAIANVECEKNNPSIEIISKLICNLNINANWLIAGVGEMFITSGAQKDELKSTIIEVLKDLGIR